MPLKDGSDGAVIEIIERTNDPDPLCIVPNEVRINGHKLLTSADDPIELHGVSIYGRDVVKVTLTLFAKRVVVASEPKETVATKPSPDLSQDDIMGALRKAGHGEAGA